MEKFASATPGAALRLQASDGADRISREGKTMNKLTRRIAVTACSVAVAGAAVLSAGGTASAATSASAHVQHPAVNAGDDRWDHGVGYLLELGYSWDEIHGWHRDGQDEISGRGTASAATSASAHVQHPAVSVNVGDYRWDHGVGYLLFLQGYSWDEIRGWDHDGRDEISGS
ncbi:hypothetical protein OG564_41285 [Streptomyces sp. NBC_01280]|uniref:hypothetical protein n=1 Tax=unclassified Streptomyces TaxID=2593676 RepID=UPI002E31C8CF|nr:hypothetical protein [Streptomyces sp. NBC_01280]WSE12693.1 hypothetical protein OG518_04855 [Streptomyces sp. NBC_01397]